MFVLRLTLARLCIPPARPLAPICLQPKKRLYRARAHSNPLNDQAFEVPSTPNHVDWDALFPCRADSGSSPSGEKKMVEFLDVGCGFGGYLIK